MVVCNTSKILLVKFAELREEFEKNSEATVDAPGGLAFSYLVIIKSDTQHI